MISLYLGNVGSGKTASAVREIIRNPTKHTIFTNIELTKKIHRVRSLEPAHIFNFEYNEKKGRDMPASVNKEFWKKQTGAVSVILDEVHTLLNARKPGAKVNIIMSDWLALIRRVLGSAESGEGQLILISQLPRRIDVIAREMANLIKYHICHYVKRCQTCGVAWRESSRTNEPSWICPSCRGLDIKKTRFIVEVYSFNNIFDFNNWDAFGIKTWYNHYYITDIEKTFKSYNTKSWDNLLSEFY